MVIDWNKSAEHGDSSPPPLIPAAEYVRMSTEHQKYSTDNQSQAIRKYAAARGYEIVATYADEGKSGLNIEGRDALRRLLTDVEGGTATFSTVLVYDVSRWGRFQDPDEAASYELRCKRAGVRVHYCAEQFENDGTIGSSIIKTVKRAMAGEYSRELSVKVFAGQSHLIRLGFRQGGPAGYGLRRVLVDESGKLKGELARGEHKSIATDRVILRPGPVEEVEVVREIYAMFCAGRSEQEIATALNAQGRVTDLGRPWSRGTIHQVLINDKYVGDNVWGRTSFKLKQIHVRNTPGEWIRAEDAFEAIVDRNVFDQAKQIIEARSARLTDDEMLARLQTILACRGALSGLIIDEAEDCPSSSCFQSRFGSLLRAYALVGFAPNRDYRYLEINRSLRRLHPEVIAEIVSGLKRTGATVSTIQETDLLRINDEFSAALVIARCRPTNSGYLRWKIRLDTALRPDLTIAVRMDEGNLAPRDYYLLPRLDIHDAVLKLAEYNGVSLDSYRFDALDSLYRLAARAPIRRAA